MKLFLDCEYNGFKGELISMALVDEAGREWYETLHCANPHPWVAENVVPILRQPPVEYRTLQESLYIFLRRYPSIHVIADWPEDIAHFCKVLITGRGYCMNTPPLTMEITRDLEAVSDIPHNALSDARAMRQAYMSRESKKRLGRNKIRRD